MQFKSNSLKWTVLGSAFLLLAGHALVAAAADAIDTDATMVAVSDADQVNEMLDANNVDHRARDDVDDGAKDHMDDGAVNDVNHDAQNDGAFENDVKSSAAEGQQAQQDAAEAGQHGHQGSDNNGPHG